MPAAPAQRSNPSPARRIHVTITNSQRSRLVDLCLLRRIVTTMLSELPQIGRADLGIHLVATPEITRLNETFLCHTGSTDVITFDYSDHAARNPASASSLHGEIFICLDIAVAQARRFRTTWQSEVVRYAVHGVLHLLGFDDSQPAARRTMKRAEHRWLRTLNRRLPLTKLARRRNTR